MAVDVVVETCMTSSSRPEKMDDFQLRDRLFIDLMGFILRANPEDDLAQDPIASRLEALGSADRAEIVDRVLGLHSPLFLAAMRGLPKIVIYLLERCDANIEKRGIYEVEQAHNNNHVTPLWCAAFFVQQKVCEVLVERGADIHAVSEKGSTPILPACYGSNLAIVEYLVDKGADVNQANSDGVTCLMAAAQSVELSEFLILKGANVHTRDLHSRTALCYAIRDSQLETLKLLLRHDADYLAQDKYGDDALWTACLRGGEEITNYLIDNLEYPPERIADAYELLGATFVDENDDIDKGTNYWKKAVEYREENNIVKDTSYPTHPVFMGLVPFRTAEEISALTGNLEHLRVHCLMIYERVFGRSRKENVLRLMYRGATFADRLLYDRCIDMWEYALDSRLSEESLLDSDMCLAFRNLAEVLFDRYEELEGEQNVDWSSKLNDVVFLLEKCAESFPKAIEQLKKVPTSQTHEVEEHTNWDRLLEILVHLLHLAAIMPKSRDDNFKLGYTLQLINRIAPTTVRGNSLLHLAVGHINGDIAPQPIFPDPITTRLLLKTGAALEATNQDGSTALHLASLSVNYREEIVKSLLGAGAHIDRPDHLGRRPHQMLKENQDCTINVTNLITLECLAATKVKSLKDKYGIQVPKRLIPLVEMH